MTGKSTFIVRNFFVFHSDKNEEQCKICQNCFKGSYTATMRRHLVQCHEDAYLRELEENPFCEPIEKKRKFEITLSQREMRAVCEQMVNNIPPEVLDSDPFRSLTEQLFAGLEMSLEEVFDIEES